MTTLGSRRNQNKHFLYRLTPVDPKMLQRDPTPPESQAIADHYQYLKRLTVIGTLLLAGRTGNDDENTFGIVIFEADSEEDAQRIMGNDPAILDGVMTAELFPFRISLQRRPDFVPRV